MRREGTGLQGRTMAAIVDQRLKQLGGDSQSCSMQRVLSNRSRWEPATTGFCSTTHTHTHTQEHGPVPQHPPAPPPPKLQSSQPRVHLLPQQPLLSQRCASLRFPSWANVTGPKSQTKQNPKREKLYTPFSARFRNRLV